VDERLQGTVMALQGNVVDVRFDAGLPPLRQKLVTREPGAVVMEVANHLDARAVRCIALTPTRGLARGAAVVDTSGPLEVPVGESLLGRMLNVFGEVIDGGAPLEGVERRSIHRPPVPLGRRAIRSEIFETGIKVIALLSPLERGGKAGLFGGAGVSKAVLITEMIHNVVGLICGIGEHSREAEELYRYLRSASVAGSVPHRPPLLEEALGSPVRKSPPGKGRKAAEKRRSRASRRCQRRRSR